MLKKLTLKPGVNRENTRYTNENGWYECDKIRFRQGTPEKIGGWVKYNESTYNGICRSLFAWATLASLKYTAVGTNTKYYVEFGGTYFDITPFRATASLTDPFATSDTLSIVTVTDTSHGASVGDWVKFAPASTVGGLDLNGTYEILTVPTSDTFTFDAGANATSTVAAGGGATTASYEISPGAAIVSPLYGWSAGKWGSGVWGTGGVGVTIMRLWSQYNFGEDLIFNPRGGALYYFDSSAGVGTHAVNLTTLGGASDVPTVCNYVTVSDIYRFVMAFGCNELGSSTLDPMLIRWSDQEDAANWTPAATNQAGGLRVSHGSSIITAVQARQEVLVLTDTALYSLQYVGAPIVWGATIMGDNISCIGPNAVAYAANMMFWMGLDKFYMYDGTVRPLPCDLRQYVFSDINMEQGQQSFAGTNEGFSEIWWFYCSSNSTAVDRYVVYNYLENVWYYGNMGRSAWLDTGILERPLAATYNNKLVYHESGVDDQEGDTPAAIEAYISSAEFDIEDGDRFGFIWRVLPDVTFRGSTSANPSGTMTLIPMVNSGSGYTTPASVGGSDNASIVRSATVPIEAFTGQVYIRVRGRQMILKMASDTLGTAWQLGSPRIDIRQDGRR